MTRLNEQESDALLAALLASPPHAADRGFALQVERRIDADVAAQAAYSRARSRFWRSFAFEACAVAALLAALWILSSAPLPASLAGAGNWGLAPPLLLILLLWFGTQRWRQV